MIAGECLLDYPHSRLVAGVDTPEDAHKDTHEYERHAGHCVVVVRTARAGRRRRQLRVLTAHGAGVIPQWSRLAVETMWR